MEWEEEIVQSDCHVIVPRDVTFPEFIFRHARTFGNKTALVDGLSGTHYSYTELEKAVETFSLSLGELGFKNGDRLCLFTPNCVEFIVAYFAVMSLGGIVVPLNPLFTTYELEYYLNDSQATFIIAAKESLQVVVQVSKIYNRLKHIIVIDDNSNNYRTFQSMLIRSESEIIGAHRPWSKEVINTSTTAAALLYSSGTTGRPKGCVHTHFNYVCGTVQRLHPSVNFIKESVETLVATIPMYHSFGQLLFLCHGLYSGATTVVLPRFHIEVYLETVHKYRATILALPPPAMAQLVYSPLVPSLDLTCVRVIVTGAAPVNARIVEQLRLKLGKVQLIEEYGMTELFTILCGMTSLKDQGIRRRPTGKLLPSMQAKIIDVVSGKSLGPNQNGEICIRTPCRMMEYWRNEEATRNSITEDGWLKTGDIGYYDEQQRFYVIERIKDLLKYNGYQVSPVDLEDVLMQYPSVLDAAVVGKPDEISGDLPTAFVVHKTERIQGATDDIARQIMNFVSERVAPQKKLRGGIRFVDEIPKSPSGKVLRNVLRETMKKSQTTPKHSDHPEETRLGTTSIAISPGFVASKL